MSDFSQPCKGSKVKVAVWAGLPSDLHLSGVDFFCEFIASIGRQTITKDEMVMIDDDNYIAVVDTAKTGTGELYLKLHAELPDSDVLDTGIRQESAVTPTGIRVVG